MKMQTDDLIDTLARQGAPVTRLRAPGVRALWWAGGALAYVAAALMLVSTVMSNRGSAMDPLFFVQQFAALTTGITAAYAAFASTIPAASGRARSLPVLSATLWLLSLGWGVLRDVRITGTIGIASETDWPCVVSMAVGGVLLGSLLIAMLRRGAPLTPRTTAFTGGIAALSIASIEACLTRPHAFTSTVLLWHGATVLTLATVFAWSGNRLLHWPNRLSWPRSRA
jgi:hypothetical protein